MIRSWPNCARGDGSVVPAPPPRLLRVRSSRRFILVAVCVSVFTDIFLYGIIVPVLPFAIASRAAVPEPDVQYWISVLLAVYGVAILVTSPISGWYADRSSSRRLPLLIGLLALAGATILLCLARSVALLVTGRILQGMGDAVVWTVGQALLVDTVGQRDIGQVLGYVSISMTLGVLLAPLLGGVVYSHAGYYPVFYMAFGLILVDAFLRLSLVEKKIAAQWIEKKDVATPPSNTETGSKQIQAVARPTANPQGSNSRMYPPVFTLLLSRRLLAALWGCMVQGSVMTALDSVLPLFVQRVFNWNSTGAGLAFIPFIIPSVAAPLVGAISDRYGPRWLIVAGFLFVIPPFALLRLVTENTLDQKILFCSLLSLIGIALTLVTPPLMAEITYVVEAKEKKRPGIFGNTGAYAQAYGLFVMAWAAGSLCGPLWAGLVQDRTDWATMTWTFSLFSGLGALPALIWTGGLITEKNAKNGCERSTGGSADKPEDGGLGAREV